MKDGQIGEFLKQRCREEQLRRAFADTYRQIGIDLLDKYMSANMDDPTKELLKNTNDALGRMILFSGNNSGRIMQVDKRTLLDLLFIYKTYKEVYQYFFDTYETLPNNVIRKKWGRASMEQVAKFAESRLETLQADLKDMESIISATIYIDGETMEEMQASLTWLYYTVFGENDENAFISTFRRQMIILNSEVVQVAAKQRILTAELLGGGPKIGNA
ncbi:MAG: hypothetical protein KGJ89_01200 [Patescibacteria group bacterium]|nr:hypothetical protein [Patescibacteria group bacterium]MDE2015128.1 hypothetical protein [Patescibacteria group bacterium]MDE2226556.1 hypothetical protein [Patescibacteria group bacterium]